ncbi:hypothetical protein [Streptomyces europaeiscabiei]|uniref:hypothetical protein n=1 Tax=Streptomyces europaeiscabiei TaxID=146819 RepID=UPI0029BE41C2|nr:hypothetical protein [Streptomyces europaeiscabiei]MDX3867292.1 hypothetical protein [Streptomyces europaeiscabiei]
MSLYDLPRPATTEPIPGQKAALETTAAAGRRAADWLRSLPGPTGNPITGDLADAVQEATAGLDPADCDDRDRWGDGGVPQGLRDRLDVAYGLATAEWLSPVHRAVIVAVTGCVLAMPKALANDPITAVDEDLPALCAMLDSTVDVLAAAASDV